jgi:MFS family permease
MSLFIGLLGLTWRHVYLFWAAPLALGIVLILRLREESPNNGIRNSEPPGRQDISEPKSLFTKGLMILLVFVAVRTVAMQIVSIFMPLFIVDERGFTVEQMGIIYGSSSLTGLVASPAGGFLAARFGSKRWLSASVVMSTAMLSLVAVAPSSILFSIAYIIYGFVGTLGMAARSTLIANLTPSSRRGMGYALLFLPSSIMAAISPLFAAGLIGLFGMWRLFPISILISVVSLAILVLGIKEP